MCSRAPTIVLGINTLAGAAMSMPFMYPRISRRIFMPAPAFGRPPALRDIGPMVGCLLVLCRPMTILGRVAAVVVDAINTQALWSRPHVFHKVCERMLPSITNRYPAPAIVLVLRMSGPKAALFHVLPSLVQTLRLIGHILEGHLDLLSRGVMGRAVTAAPSPNFTIWGLE